MSRSLPRASLVLLGLLISAAVLVPWLSPHDYFTPDWDHTELPPQWSRGHLLGTDELGRDLLVRLMWSCRISLLVAGVASLISLVIGLAWGVTAGYFGGRVDSILMRVVDVLYSVPFTPFVIVLTVLFGVYPKPVLDMSAASVQALVNNYSQAISVIKTAAMQ